MRNEWSLTKAEQSLLKSKAETTNEEFDDMCAALLAPALSTTSPYDRVYGWHRGIGLPTRIRPTNLSVSDRERRLRIMFEEVGELIEAQGFRLVLAHPQGDIVIHDFGALTFQHVEGSQQDLVESCDALQDIIVTCLGHGVEHGFDMDESFREVMIANGTKVPPKGKPLVNQCKYWTDPHAPYTDETRAHCTHQLRAIGQGDIDFECTDPNHFHDPSKPKGKVLKPESYVAPDIAHVMGDLPNE